MAYERLEPWGEIRADLRAGIIASTVVNCQRTSDSGSPVQPSDFMPDFMKESKPLDPKETSDQIKAFFTRVTGKV